MKRYLLVALTGLALAVSFSLNSPSSALAAVPECSWEPQQTYLYDLKYKLPDSNTSSFTNFPWNNTSTAAVLFETSVTQTTGQWLNGYPAGKYLLLAYPVTNPQTTDMSTLVRLYVESVSSGTGLDFRQISGSNNVRFVFYRLNSDNGVNPEAQLYTSYSASSTGGNGIAVISCVKAWRNVNWTGTSTYGVSSPYSGVVPAADGKWPILNPVTTWNGTSFKTAPDNTGGTTTTIVNAGDFTKDYAYSLALKGAALALASFLAWLTIKQFRWRFHD